MSPKSLDKILILLSLVGIIIYTPVMGQEKMINLDLETASRLARIPMACLNKEYPNKLNQVLGNMEDLKNPEVLHPAFYGCFDWHSSVHGHWMLIKLVKLFPEIPEKTEIFRIMDQNLRAENIKAEIEYFQGEYNKTYERTYGWAWLLKLAQELNDWDHPKGKTWLANILPLADLIREKYTDFLPNLTYPIRTGEHPNTAFGLSLAYDYATSLNDTTFIQLIESRSKDYYLEDKNCPISWEPNGFDFLSPCLEEANLMEKILSTEHFQAWITDFMPDFSSVTPAIVSDRSDPKIVHLDGLNFSRAWCLLGISNSMPKSGKDQLIRKAGEHFNTSFPHLSSGNYEGEHWLTSFALLALTTQL
jgi:hypothetical protein